MYKIKNLICKILIGIMIFSSLPINAFAENDNAVTEDFEIIAQSNESLDEDTEITVEENNKEIYYFNDIPYVISDKNEDNLGVFLYSQQTWNEDSSRKYISFVNTVSCEDIINDPIIHKIDEKFLPEGIALKSETVSIPQVATIGQILSVKAIDENGKPTEWETIDLPKAAAAITDATGDTVSAEQFNTLLASLRAAGYLAIE